MAEIPDGLRPAQLGVVLVGRPVLGHAAATLVSLARRGLITARETDGTWRLGPASPSSGTGDPARSERTRFEEALLTGLPPEPFPLSALSDVTDAPGAPAGFAPALRQFADDLVKDAVRRGSLKRRHHDQRTPRGEELAARTRALRTALRRARTAGDEDTLGELLEYALVFGLLRNSDVPLARFAAAFTAACSDLPGWRQPEHRRGQTGGPDFTHDEWRGMGLGGAAILSSGL